MIILLNKEEYLLKVGDLILTKHYIPVHGYVFNVIQLKSIDDIIKISQAPDGVVMVSNEKGSFGETIDRLMELESEI